MELVPESRNDHSCHRRDHLAEYPGLVVHVSDDQHDDVEQGEKSQQSLRVAACITEAQGQNDPEPTEGH